MLAPTNIVVRLDEVLDSPAFQARDPGLFLFRVGGGRYHDAVVGGRLGCRRLRRRRGRRWNRQRWLGRDSGFGFGFFLEETKHRQPGENVRSGAAGKDIQSLAF